MDKYIGPGNLYDKLLSTALRYLYEYLGKACFRPPSRRIITSPPASFPIFSQLPDVIRSRIWGLAGFRPLSGRILKSPPTTFFRFIDLPTEIRINIWGMAMDSGPAESREFKVSGWNACFRNIPYASIAENWAKPWSEAIGPPFNAIELEEAAVHGAIFEAMDFRGPPLPKHVQQVLASCREARGEFLKRYIRFSGSAKRTDLLIFDEADWSLSLRGLTAAWIKAEIVARTGTTYYQVDSEHSLPSYFDVRHDRLFVRNSGMYDILGRWLPKQVFEKLRFLSINEGHLMLYGERTRQMLLQFTNLERLIVFAALPSVLLILLSLPSRLLYRDAMNFVQTLAEGNPRWKKPHVTCEIPRARDTIEDIEEDESQL